MWVVAFKDGEGTPYGPLPNRDIAERFAEFVTAEVDPAVAQWLSTYREPDTLQSPVRALLDWRDHAARSGGDAA